MNRAIVAELTSTLATYAGPLAQTTGPAGSTAKPPDWLTFITSLPGLMMILLVVFWVFILGSKRKEDRKKKEQMGALKRGDRVQTIGGIIGTVVTVEDAKVRVKVDEGNDTKIWFSRSAIFQVLGDEKAVEVPPK